MVSHNASWKEECNWWSLTKRYIPSCTVLVLWQREKWPVDLWPLGSTGSEAPPVTLCRSCSCVTCWSSLLWLQRWASVKLNVLLQTTEREKHTSSSVSVCRTPTLSSLILTTGSSSLSPVCTPEAPPPSKHWALNTDWVYYRKQRLWQTRTRTRLDTWFNLILIRIDTGIR